jgi:2-(1,2-epoxy-1,2-dihydrophenyl)acetyl-CoA isomerase
MTDGLESAGEPERAALPRIIVRDHGLVRVITLNIPKKRNALDLGARIGLLAALRAAESASRAIVLTGAGGFFSAGGDIQAMSDDPVESAERLDALGSLARQLVHSAIPVVAAVEGGAFGMGLSIACGATYVVSTTSARFEASFAKIGLAPDTGLSWTLPRRIGRSKARQMMLMLLTLKGEAALHAGLVDEVVDDGQALARALEVAQQLSHLSAPVVAGVAQLLANDLGSIEAASAAEARLQIALLQTSESIELRARFVSRPSQR